MVHEFKVGNYYSYCVRKTGSAHWYMLVTYIYKAQEYPNETKLIGEFASNLEDLFNNQSGNTYTSCSNENWVDITDEVLIRKDIREVIEE